MHLLDIGNLHEAIARAEEARKAFEISDRHQAIGIAERDILEAAEHIRRNKPALDAIQESLRNMNRS